SVSSAWLGSSGTLEPAMMARIRAFATSRGVTADHQAADHLGVHDDGNDKKRRQRLIEKRPDAQDQDAQVPSEPHGVLQTLLHQPIVLVRRVGKDERTRNRRK